ncbi:SMODS domain-containing nucleotidyltransferase [Pectobacterium aroidearum]|uniref:SMODS domain-containing nucleotidyltransferase n=1 Tax=Pectobacterium aroidearum TaxID=1201031 RepID=UPI0032EAD982
MPRTIEEGFSDFHDKLKTTAAETAAAKSHRASIESCLKDKFNLTQFFRIGSFGNGTNISGYSDVDYLASIPTENLKKRSSVSLSNVKEALATRFPNTGVRVSCPAVVCPFGKDGSETTEIVVADYIKEENNFSVYEIADGNDEWMRISPEAHNDYVRKIDNKHDGKVKKLIRFIKAWKYFRDVPIKSFYLEMRVAKYAESEQSIVFDIDVNCILNLLLNSELSAMQDPMGIAGYIYPCQTDSQKNDVISKLKTAVSRSEKARNLTREDKIQEAFECWRLLYNDKFPSYYR